MNYDVEIWGAIKSRLCRAPLMLSEVPAPHFAIGPDKDRPVIAWRLHAGVILPPVLRRPPERAFDYVQ